MKTLTTHLCLTTFVVGLAACASGHDDVCIADRILAANGIIANKLAANGIIANGIIANRLLTEELPMVPLTTGSIADVIDPVVLEDEYAREVLEYMVGCALSPDQRVEVAVDGDVLVYEGALGLAPQWGAEDGECDEQCAGWVSACLIARTNFEGVSMPISLLGNHPGLEPTEEEALAFTVEEATYFGDLFGADKTMYACVPAGSGGPQRTCGDDPQDCVIAVVGECDAVCDAQGCRGADGVLHTETITVNLRDDAAACE
jgi:hypothetical protein